MEEGTSITTAARVRRMTTAQLQRDPVLWAAYTRGWEDRTAVFHRATSGGPTTAGRHNRSRSPRRVTRPAANTRPATTARPTPTIPAVGAPVRPPPRPLMERGIPAPRLLTTISTRTAANPLPTQNATAEMTAPAALNARQRRNKQRLRDYIAKQASQQHRLEKPVPPPPAFTDVELPTTSTATDSPVPEIQAPEVPATSGNVSDSEDWDTMDVSLTPVGFDDMEHLDSTWWTASPCITPGNSPTHQ